MPLSIVSQHTDLPTLDKRRAPRLFDSTTGRNQGMQRIEEEMSFLPDDTLIATLVSYGQPRVAAEQVRTHPPARFLAARFWCDVQDAAEGDAQAKERLDYMRSSWEELRKLELIDERLEHTAGIFDR